MAKDKAGLLEMLHNPVTDKTKLWISQKANFKILIPVCTQNLSTLPQRSHATLKIVVISFPIKQNNKQTSSYPATVNILTVSLQSHRWQLGAEFFDKAVQFLQLPKHV